MCTIVDEAVSCACDVGYAGIACEGCADGYHDDGLGECTTDACLPNPCDPERRCVDVGGTAECQCPPGRHDEAGACVPDTACMPSTCAGHGTCTDGSGGVECSCETGWGGAYCDACDEGAGYHDDGMGGCTTDACLPNPCVAPNQTVCVLDELEGTVCLCDAGFHADGAGGCIADEVCTPESCGAHGTCSVPMGAITCACDLGWSGAGCDACDAAGGYHADGAGGCTTDICLPNPCTMMNRGVCALDGAGGVSCSCDAGTHEEAGACVVDEVCLPTSCNLHGTCSDSGGVVSCACSAGWAGPACAACDASSGYHDDGMGGCTTDVCLPNPCVAADRSVCTPASGGAVTCSCDPGYHDLAGACVVDEVCLPTSCNGHGACSVSGGVVTCSCGVGWTGSYCGACDATAGYHDDGMGGCTTDVCLPNPCTDVNRGMCSDAGGTAACACDAGYHDDGIGGCTTDPCLPDPCAAMGQACRSPAGVAECYTPICDDSNSCTDDSFDGMSCVFTPRADGVSCSSTLCTAGQTCAAGICGGGVPVVCDDSNLCTTNGCDAITGCDYVIDDSLVPDDGLACTLDSCSAGVASNVATDSVCDDGLFCTGVDACVPGDVGADARGCVITDVPAAPGPDGPCGSWACSEASRSYSLTATAGGTSCSDTVSCTSGDACDGAGACRGTPTAGCDPGTSCSGTTPLGSSIDIPAAHLTGSLTFDGASVVGSIGSDEVNLWLRNRSTGTLVHLEQIDFDAWSGSAYPVRSWDFRDDRVIDLDVIPGVYDVVYERLWGTDPLRDWGGPPDNTYAYGRHVLMEGVVFGPGTNVLDVDIPAAHVTGTLTFNGGPVVGSVGSDEVNLWLRNRSTGSLVHLEQIDFDAWSGSEYPVRSWDYRDDRVIDLDVVPGTYDIVYRRLWGTDSSRDWGGPPDNTYAYGDHVLVEGVVLGPGTTTLDVDIPAAHVTGSLTFDGAGVVGSVGSDEVNLWLRNRSTGSLVHLEQIDFDAWSGSGYPVRSWDYRDDRVIDLDVVPGTYDIVYRRLWGTDSSRDWGGPPDNTYAYGDHVLVAGVVLGPGTSTLDVDIPAAHVTGSLTFDGGPVVGSVGSDEVNLWLRNRSTGSLVHLEQIDFDAWSGSGYPVRSWDYRDDRVIELDVVPGTYDIVYRRLWGTDSSRDWGGPPDNTYAYGDHVLVAGVVLGPGTTTLDVDIPAAHVTGSLTFDGGPVVGSVGSDEVNLWLRNRSTGSLVHLEQIDFDAWSGSGYPVRSWDFRDDRVIDLDVVPGTYDIVYRRLWGTDPLRDWGGPPDNTYAYGDHVLRACVAVP